jgi:hypothetical protein
MANFFSKSASRAQSPVSSCWLPHYEFIKKRYTIIFLRCFRDDSVSNTLSPLPPTPQTPPVTPPKNAFPSNFSLHLLSENLKQEKITKIDLKNQFSLTHNFIFWWKMCTAPTSLELTCPKQCQGS